MREMLSLADEMNHRRLISKPHGNTFEKSWNG